jgi:SAM-dependent methyltransferase
MSENAKHDAWSAGDSYEAYMGRWSRKVAPRFLDWLDVEDGRDWLDVGCGTGALSAAILGRCRPRSLVGVEKSEGFVAAASRNVQDERATFEVGDALALPVADRCSDVVVSALVLNFLPDIPKALAEMQRAARPSGVIAFYVWDYPGGGMELMRAFWNAAVALDAAAADFAEGKRFPFCTPEGLMALATESGLRSVATTAIEVATAFADFDDYWRPFTLGAGPAPGYCASLSETARQELRKKLEDELPRGDGGSIPLKARAWALKALSA